MRVNEWDARHRFLVVPSFGLRDGEGLRHGRHED
jgi:hypothetical protein